MRQGAWNSCSHAQKARACRLSSAVGLAGLRFRGLGVGLRIQGSGFSWLVGCRAWVKGLFRRLGVGLRN